MGHPQLLLTMVERDGLGKVFQPTNHACIYMVTCEVQRHRASKLNWWWVVLAY